MSTAENELRALLDRTIPYADHLDGCSVDPCDCGWSDLVADLDKALG